MILRKLIVILLEPLGRQASASASDCLIWYKVPIHLLILFEKKSIKRTLGIPEIIVNGRIANELNLYDVSKVRTFWKHP